MAKSKRLNEQSSEVIADNHLLEDVDPSLELEMAENKIVEAKVIPQMETITFINQRDPGVPLYFHFHSKTHPLKHYTLAHGQKYTLPVEVIRHLEGESVFDPWSCHTRKYSRRMREDGVSETYASSYVPNFQCKATRV